MFRALLFSACLLSISAAQTFVNPIAEGADPCVIRHGDKYLWCQSAGKHAKPWPHIFPPSAQNW